MQRAVIAALYALAIFSPTTAYRHVMSTVGELDVRSNDMSDAALMVKMQNVDHQILALKALLEEKQTERSLLDQQLHFNKYNRTGTAIDCGGDRCCTNANGQCHYCCGTENGGCCANA